MPAHDVDGFGRGAFDGVYAAGKVDRDNRRRRGHARAGRRISDNAVGDPFIFVTEQGTIAGWQEPNGERATLRAGTTTCSGVYKGVTIARGADGKPFVFAATFRSGKIVVFDSSYAQVNTPGGFVAPNLRRDSRRST